MAQQEQNTRERILAAAREAFIASGFKGATVRDICGRAGANVAAVNYHFGDKNGLYLAVLDKIFSEAFMSHVQPPWDGNNPWERFRVFVRGFMERVFHHGPDPDQEGECRLVAQAMTTPSESLDVLVERYVRPMSQELRMILARILGVDDGHETVWLCAKSVVGQCLHYIYGRAMMRSLAIGYMEDEDIDKVVDHIVRFSCGGIREIAEGMQRCVAQ